MNNQQVNFKLQIDTTIGLQTNFSAADRMYFWDFYLYFHIIQLDLELFGDSFNDDVTKFLQEY